MKICYVVGQDIFGMHGGSTHIYEVAKELAKRGHTVYVIAPKINDQKLYEEVDGFYIHRVKILTKIPLMLILKTLKVVKKYNIDIIMERYEQLSGAGVLTGLLIKKPVILEVNAPLIETAMDLKTISHYKFINIPLRFWRYFLFKYSSKLIAPNLACIPNKTFEKKLKIVCWGANTTMFSPNIEKNKTFIKSNVNVITYHGSFRRWHGVDDFVLMGENIIKKHNLSDVHFLIIGDGPLMNEIKEMIKERKIEKYFTITGSVPYKKIPAYLSISTVAVAPFNTKSRRGFENIDISKYGFFSRPLKLFEYMAMGLPIVTTDIYPLNEIIRDGVDGLLVEEGDIDGFAKKVLQIIDDRSLAERLGRNARERVVENYSWKKHVDDIEEIINKLGS